MSRTRRQVVVFSLGFMWIALCYGEIPEPPESRMSSQGDNGQNMERESLLSDEEPLSAFRLSFLMHRVRHAFNDAAPLSPKISSAYLGAWPNNNPSSNKQAQVEKHEHDAPSGSLLEHHEKATDLSPEKEKDVNGVRVRMSIDKARGMRLRNPADPTSTLDRIYFSDEGRDPARRRDAKVYASPALQGTEARDRELLGETPERTENILLSDGSQVEDDTRLDNMVTKNSGNRLLDGEGSLRAPQQKDTSETTENSLAEPRSNKKLDVPRDSKDQDRGLNDVEDESSGLWGAVKGILTRWSDLDSSTNSTIGHSEQRLSQRDVNVLVNEIIHQVQLRTRDEFTEHKAFVEREHNFAIRAAVMDPRRGHTLHEILDRAFLRTGLSQESVASIMKEAGMRFRVPAT